MNKRYNHAALTDFILETAASIQTIEHFEAAKEACISFVLDTHKGSLSLNEIVKEAMELYTRVIEAYSEGYANPVTAPFTDWLNNQCLQSPDFEAAHKCHDWRNYVSSNMQDHWALLTNREKAIVAIMGQAQADKENWD